MKNWSRRIARYAWSQLRPLMVVLALVVVGAGIEALKPWPMKLLVDSAVTEQPLPPLAAWITRLPGTGSPQGLIAWLTGMTVVLFLASSVVKMTQAYVQAGASTRMMYELGGDLFDHLQRLSLRFHSHSKTGDLVQRVMNDAQCVRDLVVKVLLPLVASSATLAIMFVVMWRLDRSLTVVALVVVPLMLVAIRLFAKDIEERGYEHAELQGQMMGQAEQTLTALPIVQAFGQEPHEDRRFGELTARTGRAYVRATVAQQWFGAATSSATAVGTVSVMLFGGLHVLDGQLSIGSLLVFLSYLTALYEPVETMAYLSAGYATAAAGARRVLQILDIHDKVEERPNARTLEIGVASPAPSIVFDDVTFGYEAGVPILKNLNLTIQSGETIALVGPTGSGKSTVLALVARLFDPWSGRVLLDGVDLRDIRLDSFRSSLAAVLQDPFILPMSVSENIAYGRPGAARDEIVEAASAAQADAFIRRLEHGYDTVLGERGVTLSGGERQRLSIARAFLKNAPLLLMDEPTASLDPETESRLISAMERLTGHRTSLIVAHRLSLIRNVNRIFVIDAGRLVEFGTEAELLNQRGLYSRLHRLQAAL